MGIFRTYLFCSITRSMMDCRRSEALLARPVKEPVGGKRKKRHKQGLKKAHSLPAFPHLHSSFSCCCSCSFCICLGGSLAGDLSRSVELLRMLRVSAGIGDNSVALLTCPMGAALAALSGALQKPRRSSSSASARCVFCA